LPPPDWLGLHRGQGLLPARSAGILEAARLSQRYGSLHQNLQALGPGERRRVVHGALQAELLWHGDRLVVWHSAQVRCAHHQELWLALLLATAAGEAPRRGLLIGRDGDRFRALVQLTPPACPQEAECLLKQLIAWRQQGRQHCWPLPPETGWAYAQAEGRQAGSGRAKAIACWDGGPNRRGERQQASQALCFGADRPGRELVDAPFGALACAFHGPLLARLEVLKP
jgi:exodeoxyribonuclease V gamma subunit